MAIDWDALDYDDPCALRNALRPAFYRLSAGDAEVSVEAGDYKATFAQADLVQLGKLLEQLEAECNRKNGATRRRFAIRGSFRC